MKLLAVHTLSHVQASIMDMAAFTGRFMNRKETASVHPDGTFLDVQFTKLAREAQGHFRTETVQKFALAACCIVWDIVVVTHHFIRTPHPKFRLRLPRRISIYTHICAGSAEIITAVVSFFMYAGVSLVASSSTKTLGLD